MANGRTVRTDRAREAFLTELAETCNVTASAAAAGMSRNAAYEWRKDDPEFAAAWGDAVERATDALEAEARRRAVDGVPEPVFYEGEVCGHKQRYSDRMLEILLKGHRPERFVETRKHEITGAEGGPIETVTIDASSAPADWLDKLQSRMEERAPTNGRE